MAREVRKIPESAKYVVIIFPPGNSNPVFRYATEQPKEGEENILYFTDAQENTKVQIGRVPYMFEELTPAVRERYEQLESEIAQWVVGVENPLNLQPWR